ncbi:longitudinals lacking protein, isoforms F/I/K/T isoform X19 [Hyalella azteca]|uniref:Longitudinals lacking protein, isoforms F/I/K/T isoform X19 n=1 Tax=Hyalella azteca TaxID=294128 RepID=A0A8B7PD13_HYAAZ|nr:longitudinals lacking protein, isoforms F/I/K/T isoform X19 [Hyalella azteca]
MDGGLLSLKWNNHRSTFFYVLSNVRKKECYTDVTLACDGKFYPVHKLVLSTCSEYFEQMFEQTQCKHPVIVLKDIRSEELESLLSYMYVGEVNVVQEKLSGLIKAAECLRIKGLAVPDEEPATTKSSGGSREKRTSDNSLSSEAKRRRQDDGSSSQRQTSSREETSRRRADQSSSNKFNRNNASSSSSSVNSSRENRDSVSDHRTTSRDASEPNELHHAQQDNDIELKAEELPDAHEDLPSEVPPEDPGDAVKQEPLDLDAVYLSDSNSASDTKDMLVEDSFGEADGQQHFMDELLGQNSASDQHGMGDYGEGGEGSSSSSAATNQQQQHMVARGIAMETTDWWCPAITMDTNDQEAWHQLVIMDSRESSGRRKSQPTCLNDQPSTSRSFVESPIEYIVPFDELPRVQATVNPNLNYACPVCGKEFYDKKDFRRHYMIHTGEKPYPCPHCAYRARRASALRLHVLRSHKNLITS